MNSNNIKPTLDHQNQIHYVTEYELIKFIETNIEDGSIDVQDLVRNNKLGPHSDTDMTYWDEKTVIDMLNHPTEYNPHQVKWITAFFKAHPWIKKMMICFD